jgi:hypothetical protein
MITHVSASEPRERRFYVDRDLIHACTIDGDDARSAAS